VANTALDEAVEEWRDIKEATGRVQRREARARAIANTATGPANVPLAVSMEPEDMLALIADPVVAPDGTTYNRPEPGTQVVRPMIPNNAVLDAKIDWMARRQSGALASETYVCALTGAWMIDPVVTADGDSYEREAIEAHFVAQRAAAAPGGVTSPVTGRTLRNDTLIPNVLLRSIIAAVRAPRTAKKRFV
jgi:hypothetical protein